MFKFLLLFKKQNYFDFGLEVRIVFLPVFGKTKTKQKQTNKKTKNKTKTKQNQQQQSKSCPEM